MSQPCPKLRRRATKQDNSPRLLPRSLAGLGAARFLRHSTLACLIQPRVRLGRGPVELNGWTPIAFNKRDRRNQRCTHPARAKQPLRERPVFRGAANAAKPTRPPGRGQMERLSYFTCPETSLVISNMLTCFLPLKTACRASSALMLVLTFLSCNPFLRI